MKIKYLSVLLLILSCATSCVYKDLTSTLHYSSSEEKDKIGVSNIKFQDLQEMRHGESCAYNILYVFPTGDASIIAAAKVGQVDKILFIGESGFWTFPFSKTCTVVFGN